MWRPLPLLHLLALVMAAAPRPAAAGYVPPTKYLLVSNAENGTIGYVRLARDGNHSPVRTLVFKNLAHPQGIAVDQKRSLLLVADSELRKVVSYGLSVREDGTLAVDDQAPVVEDVEARWVAVDGRGNVFVTDEQHGQVLRLSARQALDGDTQAKPVLADPGQGGGADGKRSGTSSVVKAPGGIVTDNFNVFWTNKEDGEKVGTVMRALASPGKGGAAGAPPEKVTAVARNVPKAYGLCLALDNLFFTAPESKVFAVRTRPSAVHAEDQEVVTVTSDMSNPRGCAWDGESTVYVADRSADGVFALPGPMFSLAESSAQKVVDFEGAFGVAVFSSASRWAPAPALAMLAALAAVALGGV